MDKYKANLLALDKITKTNKKLNDIDKTLQSKYTCNIKHTALMKNILSDSLDKYHDIIKNLDKFLS